MICLRTIPATSPASTIEEYPLSDNPTPEDLNVSPDRRRLFKLGAGAAAGAGVLALATATPAAATISGGTYFSVTPVRLIDTRISGGRISAGETRTSTALVGNEYVSVCNLTVVNTLGDGGYLSIYSADLASRPNPYSSVNWQGANKVVANLAIFDTGDEGIKIYCGGTGSTNFVLDFVGYFQAASSARTAKQRAFESRAREAARRLGSA